MEDERVELNDLYREILMDHFRHPRNHKILNGDAMKVFDTNPLCGDELTLSVRVKDGRIEDVAQVARGCSISQASASMMTDLVKGKSKEEALKIAEAVKALLTQGEPQPEDLIGDAISLEGVHKFPVRVKCALLAWMTLLQALKGGK